jgi:hypothetical protein
MRSVLAEKQDDNKPTDKNTGNSPAPGSAAAGLPAGNVAMLGTDIEIMCDRPMPHLDSGELKAYAAKLSSGKACFAVLCENFLVPRTFLTSKFSQLANTNIVRIVAAGVVFWPPENRQRYTFVYEDTLGKPILPASQPQALGIKHERLMNVIVKPLIFLMLELRDADLVHGGIRATNIYDGGAVNYDHIILGESLSAPPTYHQPSIYMPIEKALTPAYARGVSSFSDDIFALGITILTLMRKDDPFVNMREEDIMRQRIEHGTYSFFTTHQRNTGPLMELLRGMLHDDWLQRWTIEEVLAWLDGKRLGPKKGRHTPAKAVRAYEYDNVSAIRPEGLAYELQLNPTTAKETIQSDAFETWVQRSLSNDRITTDLHDAKQSAQINGQDGGYPDRLLSKTINVLYNQTPIIYKNLRAMPEGLGYLAAYLFGNSADTKSFEEIIRYNLVGFWAKLAEDSEMDTQIIKSKFESAQVNSIQKKLGFGLEGNLYFLCHEAPCLSPVFKNYCVRSPEDLLIALEDICSKTHKTEGFVDRHIAGFLMARDKKVIERQLMALNSFEVLVSRLALLNIYATIQERAGMMALPHLSKALLMHLSPLLERYHDRSKKTEIKKLAAGLADNGNLPKLAALLNDKKLKKNDKAAFIKALQEYKTLRHEYVHLEDQLQHNKRFGYGTGYEIASIISGLIAGIVILATTFLQYSKGGLF